MLAGRNSVYDNDFYLSSTYPPPPSSNLIVLSTFQRASMAIMHIFVQCPRLNCLVRHATTHPEDTAALVSAVTLAESLWQLDLSDQVSALLTEAVTVEPNPPFESLADILIDSMHFHSVQGMILCTRYWMLINILGGLVDTLYRHFPAEIESSLLPNRYVMHKLETDAAVRLAKSIPWAESVSRTLPLVPLRLHTPLQISIGPWYRTIRRLKAVRSANPGLDADVDSEMIRTITCAERMKAWIIEHCNYIHKQWDVSILSEKPLLEALDTMAGEKIPDWLPVRVRFEAEDGEMVMKLDYENKTGSYREQFDLGEHPPRRVHSRNFDMFRSEVEGWDGGYVRELPDRSTSVPTLGDSLDESYRNKSMEPRTAANFIHGTGRNLCSTSGWWPSTEPTELTSTVLIDSTHKASAFSTLSRFGSPETRSSTRFVDRHPCLASSFWPQTPNTTTASLGSTPKNVCLSPAWSSPSSGLTTTSDTTSKDMCLLTAWTRTDTTPSSNDSPGTPS